ncbi:MAG: TatD family hydrolase [Candidatus Paceibacterota bacterium]
MTRYIDTHAHFDMYTAEEREAVLGRMRKSDTKAIAVGTDTKSSQGVVELARGNEDMFACVGIHPDECVHADMNTITRLAHESCVVAIGECGFDYFRGESSELRPLQQTVFEAQIECALTHGKPLMLHIRPSPNTMDAYDDALDLLEGYARTHGEALTGNAHFFAGGLEHARRFLDIGFTLSFTGVITFTRDYDEVIRFVPQDMIHAETDSPFVAPEPHRGKRNEPSYVPYVVERIAQIRGVETEELRTVLVDNARRCFSINL